jgi:hypothetical protein
MNDVTFQDVNHTRVDAVACNFQMSPPKLFSFFFSFGGIVIERIRVSVMKSLPLGNKIRFQKKKKENIKIKKEEFVQ